MKHPKKQPIEPGSGPHLMPVCFEFHDPTASQVSVAGTFNDWDPRSKPMIRTTRGHWRKETALPPGSYEYRLIVDGRWITDPGALESVPNPFGGRNSILNVMQSKESAHLNDAQNVPMTISSPLRSARIS